MNNPFLAKILAIGLLLFSTGGCGSSTASHVHIAIPGKGINLWSYSPIVSVNIDDAINMEAAKAYGRITIQGKQARIVLGNSKIINIGDQIMIGDMAVPPGVTNIFIAEDGSVKQGAFIRTFK